MVITITEVLNSWNQLGVFSYVLPFLLIFSVVFAILDKTKLLSSADNDNRPITAIIAVSMALLSLQFDFVSNFFAVIFPRFGVGLSLFLVVLIFLGFFSPSGDFSKHSWVGYVIGIGVFIWSLSSWGSWSGDAGFGGWFVEYIWSIAVLGIIVAAIVLVSKKPKTS